MSKYIIHRSCGIYSNPGTLLISHIHTHFLTVSAHILKSMIFQVFLVGHNVILVPCGVHPPVSKSTEMLGDFQRQCRCQRPNEPWKKTGWMRSIKNWLFDRDPYNGLL